MVEEMEPTWDMDPQKKFRIEVQSYVIEVFGIHLTTEQLDYVYGRLWNRYGLIGFAWHEVVMTYRASTLTAEVRGFVQHARKVF